MSENHHTEEEIPVRLKEGLSNDELSDTYQVAANKFQEYKKNQNEAGLSDYDMELLADSENPFRLEKFTEQQKLRLQEIREKVQSPPEKIDNTRETKLKLAIAEASDIQSLLNILQENGGLQGSQKFYTFQELSDQVAHVGSGLKDPKIITGQFGLRQRVIDLIKIVKLKESLTQEKK